MNREEIELRIERYEQMAPRFSSMSAGERRSLREELIRFYDSLSPYAKIGKWAAGGAVVGAVLPRVSWLAGGLIGAAIGLAKQFKDSGPRERLSELIAQLG
jgi:hypothetical protein